MTTLGPGDILQREDLRLSTTAPLSHLSTRSRRSIERYEIMDGRGTVGLALSCVKKGNGIRARYVRDL